jgi:hypothetical protein
VRRSLQPLLVLIAALAVVGAIAIAVAVPPDQGNPSSRSAGRLGTLAVYTWLQRLGLPVSRVTGTFELSKVDVLVEYDPLVTLTSSDVDATLNHVKRGGDVIMALAPESIAAAQPLLQRLGVEPGAASAPGNAVPAQPFDAAGRVRSVPMGGGFSFLPSPTLVPLLTQNHAVVAAAVHVAGGGRVVIIGDTQPLSNDGLRHDDSAYFVLSLLERARGGHVAFDEFHHGEGGMANTGAAAIFNGPVGLAAALTVVIVVLAIGLNGRRLGRPVAIDTVTVPTAGAYMDAMGELLSRSRQRGGLAARYAEDLKRRVSLMSGVDAHRDDAAFVAELRAAGHDYADDVAALLTRARILAAGRPDEAELLTLARDVDALERRWAGAASLTAQWRP